MVTFVDCFHICEAKSSSEDTAVQIAWFFHSRFNLSDTKIAYHFCIDKARKRGFTQVVLNSVLEENAIDFA